MVYYFNAKVCDYVCNSSFKTSLKTVTRVYSNLLLQLFSLFLHLFLKTCPCYDKCVGLQKEVK